MRRRSRDGPAIEAVADLTHRLAVLLAAGVSPGAAWAYLDDADRRDASGSDQLQALGQVVAAAQRATHDGDSVAGAIARAARSGRSDVRAAWQGLAAAWFVAIESGAPLAQCLRDLASAFRSLGQTERELSVALAGPAATARMVMALPVVGVLFGMGLGFNTLQTLLTTGPGLGCLGVGACLMVLGWLWNRRMIRRATPTEKTPGLLIDLTAIALAGGGSAPRAQTLVEEARTRYGLAGDSSDSIDRVIELSQRAGVPAAELLRSEADRARRIARTDGQQTAASLSVRLMLPLGICVLPAFMLLGVAPLLLAIISSTVAGIAGD